LAFEAAKTTLILAAVVAAPDEPEVIAYPA